MLIMEKEFIYNFESLLFDKSFRRWIFLKGSDEEIVFWETWKNKSNNNNELCNEAKAVLFAINLSGKYLSDDEIDYEVKKVLNKVESTKESTLQIFINQISELIPSKKQFAFAFSIILLIGIFGLNYKKFFPDNVDNIYSRLMLSDKKNVIKYTSQSDSSKYVLPDGSTVILSKNTTLSFFYRADSGFLRREAILSGEAFFDISKNPKQPFIVYTPRLTTKVLGTSFTITSYPNTKSSTVQLLTGKISVYKNEDLDKSFANPENWGGVVLVPNQMVTYNDENRTLSRSLINNPIVLSKESDLFTFSSTPVSNVFDTLSKCYNINIIYDENIFNNCTLTVSLGGESFFQKLQVICKSTQSKYEIIDGNVIISKDYGQHF